MASKESPKEAAKKSVGEEEQDRSATTSSQVNLKEGATHDLLSNKGSTILTHGRKVERRERGRLTREEKEEVVKKKQARPDTNKKKAFVLWFDELCADDVALVGGKTSSLGEMYRQLTSKGGT